MDHLIQGCESSQPWGPTGCSACTICLMQVSKKAPRRYSRHCLEFHGCFKWPGTYLRLRSEISNPCSAPYKSLSAVCTHCLITFSFAVLWQLLPSAMLSSLSPSFPSYSHHSLDMARPGLLTSRLSRTNLLLSSEHQIVLHFLS